MVAAWTQLRVDARSPRYCRVTFDHPPINTITATTVAELAELVEPDRSRTPISTSSCSTAPTPTTTSPTTTSRATRARPWRWDRPNRHARLARPPRPALPGAGGQHRVDPRAGSRRGKRVRARLRPAVRLAREHTARPVRGRHGHRSRGRSDGEALPLVGRGRALEILLVADDLDGPRAAQYGYVNRAIEDDQLDDEVEAIASRLARFDHEAIARTKFYVDQVTLPPDSEFPPALTDFFEMLGRPAQQARSARLKELGLNVDSDLERSLGRRDRRALVGRGRGCVPVIAMTGTSPEPPPKGSAAAPRRRSGRLRRPR